MKSFSQLSLLDSLQKTLAELGIHKPTEIQSKALPALLDGRSIVGVSETGSGKTLAYAIPLMHRIKTLENSGDLIVMESQPRAVVVVPTRELGEQVAKVFKNYTHGTRLRVRSVLGGTAIEVAKRNASTPLDILVATPGRLTQMIKQNRINLSDVRTLIFDEADQMLDQGFLPDANKIFEACPEKMQIALFSATVSPAVQELMNGLFATAEVIRSEGSGKVVSSLQTKNEIIKDGKRFPILQQYLNKPVKGGTLIFTNTREQCDVVAQELTKHGFKCGIYRGEMDKQERRANLKKFRDGSLPILVSTDLASRGLDVEHVGRVINYHLPQIMDNYIHRVGRTARAGRAGLVVNFVTERDVAFIDQVTGKKSPKIKKGQANIFGAKSSLAHRPPVDEKRPLKKFDKPTNGKTATAETLGEKSIAPKAYGSKAFSSKASVTKKGISKAGKPIQTGKPKFNTKSINEKIQKEIAKTGAGKASNKKFQPPRHTPKNNNKKYSSR